MKTSNTMRPQSKLNLFIKTVPILLVAALLFSKITSATAEENTLTFGYITYKTPISSYTKQEKLIKYLEKATGFKIKSLSLKNEEEIVAAFRNGKVDFAWIGSADYIKNRPYLYSYPLVKPVRYGRDFYRGAIITRSDNGITNLQMIKGKTLACVAQDSESGFIFPVLMLAQNKLYLSKDYSARFLRGHDNVTFSILRNQYDVGAVFDTSLEVYLNEKQQSEIRVIGYTKNIPYEPIIISKRVPGSTALYLKESLLQIEDQSLLKELKIEKLTPASDAEYAIYPSGLFQLLKEGTAKKATKSQK